MVKEEAEIQGVVAKCLPERQGMTAGLVLLALPHTFTSCIHSTSFVAMVLFPFPLGISGGMCITVDPCCREYVLACVFCVPYLIWCFGLLSLKYIHLSANPQLKYGCHGYCSICTACSLLQEVNLGWLRFG